MVKNISAQGFKGLDFDQPLEKKNLFVGPNGAGKSARTNALQLLVSGYVPGVGKKNGDILDAFGTGDKLFVAGKINDTHFTRRFCRDKNGSVSQDFLVDRRKANKTKFTEAMARAKAPVILDLDAVFLSLSDQKKIDYLFSLFPPAGDVGEIDQEIEGLKEIISATNKDYTAKQAMVNQLTAAKADIEMPAGTLAEIQAEINKTKAAYKEKYLELSKAKEDLAAANAKAKAESEANKKAEDASKKAKEDQERAVAEAKINARKETAPTPESKEYPKIPDEIGDKEGAAKALDRVERITGGRQPQTATASIRRIMAVAEKVDAMAVVITCKKELKLWGDV